MIDSANNRTDGLAVRVRGVVQGVGFRPFVATLAKQYGLSGKVWNDAEGVMVHVCGAPDELDAFVEDIPRLAPPLAQIDGVEIAPLAVGRCESGFAIIASVDGETATSVAADAATCPECLREILDPDNRRYRYPFTNCTHCGPRFSIIRAVPYDRQHTSMASFRMCPDCQAEYDDPDNRRFHAQPNACPDCGPQLWLENREGERMRCNDAVTAAAAWIREGRILAIKGIGGFHLACDACNEAAVSRLRQRKKRYHKPFALMGRDLAQIGRFASPDALECSLLTSVEAPVVVIDAVAESVIAAGVAPHQNSLGFMVPYTPLHHLLMQELDRPIVLTSGNLSDEPQCIDNDEARQRLRTIVDGFLMHDRDIENRLDDSVVRVMADKVRVVRRARGYAPGSVMLPPGFEAVNGVLAMGGELKNTFCLISRGRAIVSQHMGDLEQGAVLDDYRHHLLLYRQLYDFTPRTIAVDMHPDYFSTQWGRSLAAEKAAVLIEVQHHHAHVAACMAEHGLPLESRVLAVAMDGLGMGSDGRIWGGEFMLAGYRAFERIASVQAVAMPGGAKAMTEPWRNAYAQLHAIGWQEICEQFGNLEPIAGLQQKPLRNLDVMIDRGLNSPAASSAGRLFDAVAALLGMHTESASFEGQAAMALEVVAGTVFAQEADAAYPVASANDDGISRLIWQPLWLALLGDLADGVSRARIAARFHHGLINAVSAQVEIMAAESGLRQVVLSGGVFQNRLLFEGVHTQLSQAGLQVLAPVRLPANDGGLSMGQAVIAAAGQCAETP